MEDSRNFCQSYFQYRRNQTISVKVGETTIGGNSPVRVQSMTTTNTLITKETVDQVVKIANAGGELVRITTQGKKEASNLVNIKQSLVEKGYTLPLVADVHFNPYAAEIAAVHIEKVRINPGNFTGGAKKFREIEAGSEDDIGGVHQIREKLVPFLKLCKINNTAIRIGTNHGSLSDRIMSKYGDTPEGMVESCMEYLRICREEDFHNIVLSIKSSNTRVMVHTVRLLVARMGMENMHYPIHLGVTEAGSGEDGRLKSAVGIGALLADGIGDTIRVSLTEPPENEIPVAKKLVEYFEGKPSHVPVDEVDVSGYSPLEYRKRLTRAVDIAGGENPAVVMSDVRNSILSGVGEEVPEMILCNIEQWNHLPSSWKGIIKVVPYTQIKDDVPAGVLPLFDVNQSWASYSGTAVVAITYPLLTGQVISLLREKENVVLLLGSENMNSTAEQRAFFMCMQKHSLEHPVIIQRHYNDLHQEDFQLKAAADTGLLFLDGYGDGICLSGSGQNSAFSISTSFGILQASRVRFSKTEYISCPGCGRTLFDLQKTTDEVRKKTYHLKGLKIAVMGCIVNGIGEMADADYGYVGAGLGRISLYRKRELIRKNIPEENAVGELVNLIKKFGDWHESV